MKTVMFGERIPRNSSEQSKNPEQLNLERQKKKLTGFYAHGEDERYIFNYDEEEQFNVDKLTHDDEERAKKILRNDAHWKDREWKLLTRIAGPDQEHSTDEIFDEMAGDERQKRILGYMTGMKWNTHDHASGKNVAYFLKRYPTPVDFEQPSEEFLQMILDYNDEKIAQEYADEMEEFQLRMYGKKYEYYRAMEELHKEAIEERPESKRGRAENIKFGQKLFEIFNKDRLIADSGLATINRGSLIGEPNRPNEDTAYYNPAIGLFGVFDGAGGMRGGARASRLGAEVVGQSLQDGEPETPNDLADILKAASDTIQYDAEAGYSTAVLGKIVETRGRKALIWVSVGDSRIYIVRGKKAVLLTRDEGYGNQINNALGLEDCRVEQAGEFPLKKGDRVVFCSDGVTGDYESDFIPDDELGKLVRKAGTADMAAWSLINRATKRDDRTAIVTEV